MAYAVGTVYNVLAVGPTWTVTLKAATTVKKGFLIGYNSGWVLADDSSGYPALFVALNDGTAEAIQVARSAVVSGVTGATAGNKVYLDEDGQYDDDTGTVLGQVVGTFISDTEMFIDLNPLNGSLAWASMYTAGAGDAAKFPVANAAGVYVPVTMSGDATMSNAGAVAISANKVTAAMCKAAVKTNFLRGPAWDIDTAAGGAGTLDVVLLKPSVAITITKFRIVYDVEESGTVAAGNIKLGSAAGGEQYVTAANAALENTKAVGYEKNCTITSGAVTAGQAIFCRFTGVAATAAGSVHVEMEYTVNDV